MPKADRISAGGVKLLQEPQLAHFVTLMADGSPQVTPVWVDVEPDGSHILINTAEGRVKTSNVERDNRVAMSVTDKDNPWRYVLARGTIVERRHEGADAHIDAPGQEVPRQGRVPVPAAGRAAGDAAHQAAPRDRAWHRGLIA